MGSRARTAPNSADSGRNEATGHFEAAVDLDDIAALFEDREPHSTREVVTRLDISRSRAYELLRDLETDDAITSKNFEELGGVV